MRHDLLSCAIAARSRCMLQPPAIARLIAPPGRPLSIVPRLLCTAAGAVNLTIVAVAADKNSSPAAHAHEKPQRRGLRSGRFRMWTQTATSGIMPRHACSARCRGTASIRDLAVAVGAVPVSINSTGRHGPTVRSPRRNRARNARRPVDMWTTQRRCPHIHRPSSNDNQLQFDEQKNRTSRP